LSRHPRFGGEGAGDGPKAGDEREHGKESVQPDPAAAIASGSATAGRIGPNFQATQAGMTTAGMKTASPRKDVRNWSMTVWLPSRCPIACR
jgi:hypothetical protein